MTDGRNMTCVDSHHHFWDPKAFPLPALPPQLSLLNRPFLPEHLRPEIEGVGVNRTVLVQGYPQTSDFNDWLFQRANASAFIAGVVAWADLERPERLGQALDALQREAKFVGIRHMVEDELDADWIVRRPVLKSLRELARKDIPFDMLAKPTRLENVAKVLDAVPELRMVLDHAGKPPIQSGKMASWAGEIKAIGRRPQAWCKLSGLVTQADPKRWRAEKGPVLHLTFDEGAGRTVHDRSGHGNHGKIVGDVKWVKTDAYRALRFNGANTYIECGAGPSLQLTKAGTLEIWCLPETIQGGMITWNTGPSWGDARLVLAFMNYGKGL